MNRLFFENILPGTLLFKQFRLVRCLSSNDDGGVYLCTLINDCRHYVALKVLSANAARNMAKAERLRRELGFARQVTHENVIQVFDIHEDEDFLAFSMEHIDGGSLADFVRSNAQNSFHVVRDVVRQLSEGLFAIHRADIIHRDLKPENVLMTTGGTFKISDFSISCSRRNPPRGESAIISGTIDYLSPEYIQHGEVSPASDIYALGVLTYQLITGRLPFSGESLLDILSQRVATDPIPPSELRPDCPKLLNDLTLTALARCPADRYQSPHEMVIDLKQAIPEIAPLPNAA